MQTTVIAFLPKTGLRNLKHDSGSLMSAPESSIVRLLVMDHVTVLDRADMTGHDGEKDFSYSLILYRKDEEHYLGSSDPYYRFPFELHTYDPIPSIMIPPSEYCPLASRKVTTVQPQHLETCFVKYPLLRLWPKPVMDAELKLVKERVLREVQTYELLSRKPHPNIAEYLGCIIKDGLIRGICLTRYEETLGQRVNPSGIKKRRFQYGEQRLRSRRNFARDIASGLKHLHSIGLVHNDIKPSNIMIKEGETPIIIDFDSCVPEGQPLHQVGRTSLWHDKQVDVAIPSNDLDALQEISEWLSDKEVKQYQFGVRGDDELCSTCFGGEHDTGCALM